jgi:hypothetical protein
MLRCRTTWRTALVLPSRVAARRRKDKDTGDRSSEQD